MVKLLRGARKRHPVLLWVVPLAAVALAASATTAAIGADQTDVLPHASYFGTRTPIKHVVVIFDENNSFDHYFGTYPKATNTDGTPFHAKPGTPRVNGLTPKLLTKNPNKFNPKRLSPKQALTCDQFHNYDKEQKAYNNGKVDKFVESTEKDKCTGQPILFGEPGLVMDYFDGNTVTAMWNYAQNFAMNDNSFNSNFGPSTPGVINLASGNTHGIYAVDPKTGKKVNDPSVVQSPDRNGVGTMIEDPDPAYDDCSGKNHTSDDNLGVMTGRNIGDLLNKKKVTWGWFQGGFKPTGTGGGYSVCGAKHANIGGNVMTDYNPHHNPFQYYKSTSNPKHLPPSSVSAIGSTDQANHNYDLSDFDNALKADKVPAVSFLKAPIYQNGHPGDSDPIDEQHFLAGTINKIQQSKAWKDTAVFIAYDDSDGWYDHVMPPVFNGSHDKATDTAMCLRKPALKGYNNRCGYGPRLPMLAISPYSRKNHVDHGLADQTSILRFIEDNWSTGRIGDGSYDAVARSLIRPNGMFDFWAKPNTKPLILDPISGAVKK